MQFNQMAHDCQPQTQPAVAPGYRAVTLLKTIKDIRQKCRVNANARVTND
jgi:hypothetical protein